MNLTTKQLKQIIKEELEKVLEEGLFDWHKSPILKRELEEKERKKREEREEKLKRFREKK